MKSKHLLFLMFVLSGFCGLLYQIVWIRMAFAAFGVITPVLSVVISVFMLGLSVGSIAAGKLAAPLSRKLGLSAIWFYAVVEAIVGIGGIVVPRIFHAGESLLLPLGSMDSGSYLLWSALVLALSILPWCIAMGMTYPFMMAYVREQDSKESPTSFSYLYLGNVIGAMGGTILTAGFLIETLGFRASLLIATSVNFIVAILAAGLGKRSPLPAEASETARTSSALSETDRSKQRTFLIALILFSTGFLSMAMEVVWTRAFTPVLRTTIYSFAALLTIYLFATWLGSLLYRRHLASGKSLSTASLMGWLSVSAFLPLVCNDPRIPGGFFVDIGLVLFSIMPFCALLGYLTPKLIDEYSGGDPRHAGVAYAINVVGCILGPLVAGYLLLAHLGVKASLIILAAPIFLFLLAYARELGSRAVAPVAGTLAALGVSFFLTTYEDPALYEKGTRVERDHVATTIATGHGMNKRLLVNGVGMTYLDHVTKVMAHFPMTIHTNAKHALNICFGMGTTFRSLTTWPDLQTVAVELVPAVPKVFEFYHADAADVVARPNGRIVVDDGRRYLKRSEQTFDLVTIDPPPPTEAAGSSLLYTREFYDVMKRRMSTNGILMHWFPGGEKLSLNAVARALVESFPHVRVYRSIDDWGYHFVCSFEPLAIPTADEFVGRLPEPAAKDLVEWGRGRDVRGYADKILSREIPLSQVLVDDPAVIVTDDQPYTEYFFVRRLVNKLNGTHASMH